MPVNSSLEAQIASLIEPLGFEVVRLMQIGQQRPTLQIMIERADRAEITVDDCAAVSRAVSDLLDELDPIEGEYALEVSSPGLDRPLVKPAHFERFCGYEIKLDSLQPVEGRKRFKGRLSAVDADHTVHLEMEGQDYAIPFESIGKAKVVVTDELWEKYCQAHPAEEIN